MGYIKQLDSLRAIAVILVIISHWINSQWLINIIPNGPIGVNIFFVLSGFLITSILFENKHKLELEETTVFRTLKNFYIRRSLRIFPIYYLTILVLLLFSDGTETNIKTDIIYYATYTSNFNFFSIQKWDGILSHLWSLAVEEQFYLIWPCVILLSNKKYLLHIISAFILIGLVCQLITSNYYMSSILTFNCFDAFGLGALLSWIVTYHKSKLKSVYHSLTVLSIPLFLLFIIGAIQHKWTILPLRTITSLFTVWVVSHVLLNRESESPKFRWVLNNRVLIFLGKISYGLYLYHNLIPTMLNKQLINIYLNPMLPDILFKKYWTYLFLLENTLLLVCIAWVSYVFIEKPFLRLKNKFDY